MRIRYTKEAEQSLIEILEFLYHQWTSKEIKVFFSEIEGVFENIERKIVTYPKFTEDIYEALIGNKNVKIYFSVSDVEILVLFFLNCKQNPERLFFLKT